MRNVENCVQINKAQSESADSHRMKVLLCKLGKKLGFEVDIEESQETELGKLAIRHDVLWYVNYPEWYKKLLGIILSRDDLDQQYKQLVKQKADVKRCLCVAFEIEATDVTTKAMKGDISNLSKLPYGFVVVKRGKAEKTAKKVEPIRNRFERALVEFRSLHGPNNVLIVSFNDVKKLCELYGVS
jgi:broad specificity phosphatase PhoE